MSFTLDGNMALGSPEHLNRRLGQQMFIRGDADCRYFMELRALVNGLMRPGEKIVLPEGNEAGAWTKLYGIYEALKRRRTDEPHVNPERVAEASRHASLRSRWNLFCEARGRLADRQRLDPQFRFKFEYAGLRDGDLDPPIVKDGGEYGFPGWEEVARRVLIAMNTLDQPLNDERVRAVVYERRAAAEQTAMARRISALEAAISQNQNTETVENSHG